MLWSWEGRIGRLSFLTLNLILFAGMAAVCRQAISPGPLNAEIAFWLFMTPIGIMLSKVFGPLALALALPFQWSAFLLSVKRLRDLEWSVELALLAFIPFANLGLFVLLATVPGWQKNERNGFGSLLPGRAAGLVPRSDFGANALAILLSVLIGNLGFRWAVYKYESYGWALFVALPFLTGLAIPVVSGFHRSKTFRELSWLALLSMLLQLFLLMGSQSEGLVCILMASPLLFLFILAGVGVGYVIQNRPLPRNPLPPFAPALLFPLALLGDAGGNAESPLMQATTSVVIGAPPETVWENVVSFRELPPPTEFVFRTGIAYPIRATIEGHGVGAVRYCEFSTGRFVEPIIVWNEPNLLAFDVAENPPVMREANPFGRVEAPHLHGHFNSQRGQFRLIPLPQGRTLLVGTTWYRHAIAPSPYWRLWSDAIIHAIHSRVLGHIKVLSETQTGPSASADGPVWILPGMPKEPRPRLEGPFLARPAPGTANS